MTRIKDMAGMTFGKLTVDNFYRIDDRGLAVWSCLCICGKKALVSGHRLRNGSTQSCGCKRSENGKLNATHGMKGTKEYSTWSGMITRCSNKKSIGYENYGGRGISVCKEWMDFENFYKDIGVISPGLTLERIDVNLGYSKENCKLATYSEQARNKQNTFKITAFGKTMSVADWADEIGVQYQTLYRRLKRSQWSAEKSITYSKSTS